MQNETRSLLERYRSLVIEANRRVNLTAITDPQQFWEKHIEDALAGVGASEIEAGQRVLDLGSGAGVPGLPLAIVRPGLRLTLLEASRRKAAFLEGVLAELGLPGQVIHGRAEEVGRDPEHREAYDAVLARAVAPLRVLVELALPLVRPGGRFVAWKGPAAESELAEAARALAELGGGAVGIVRYTLEPSRAERRIVTIAKEGRTPDRYPRRPGVPQRKPL